MKTPRLILAFLIAPLAPAVAMALAVQKLDVIFVWAVFTYPFALALGIPAFYICRRLGWLMLWQVLAISTALGLLASCLGHVVLGSVVNVGSALIYAGSAATTGLAFWLVAFAGHSSNKALQGDGPRPAGSARA